MGNTRVVFTTNPKEIGFTLNYEGSESSPDDEAIFTELNNIVEANIHDHTDAGATYQKSQRLTGGVNDAIGSVLTIPVGAGDKVSAAVYAKYLTATGGSNPSLAIGNLLAAAITGTTGAGTYEGAITSSYGANGSMITNVFQDEVSPTEPMAFINLLFLPDEAGSSIEESHFAFKQIGSASSNVHALLALDEPFEVPSAGYVVVYLSNESDLPQEVYFDDLQVTLEESEVIQTTDYYPYGGITQQYNRITSLKNRFLFNEGTERITDLDLNVDMTQYRVYDPWGRIGWWQIDPMAEKFYDWTPYKYSLNNPIRYNDPDGRCEICKGFKKLGQSLTSKETYQEIGRGFSELGSEVKGGFFKALNALDGIGTFGQESTTNQAEGWGVTIDGETAGADSRFTTTADPNAENTVMEKDFLDGITAGFKPIGAPSGNGSFEKVPEAMAETFKNTVEAVQAGEKVFSNREILAESDTFKVSSTTITKDGNVTMTMTRTIVVDPIKKDSTVIDVE